MRLADFILGNIDPIVDAWEAFAATQLPAARAMTPLELRNHAEHILRAVAKDMVSPQSGDEQFDKSLGKSPGIINAAETAAQTHGMLRAKSGFDLNQMASEYRALRASVLRGWMQACSPQPPHLDDIIRFNEAIDQALAESIAFYTARTQHGRNLFLGMLGHDMRTPLQAIQATATYLGATNPDAAVTEAAARLIRSGNRMQALLNDLVDFNRINLGLGIAVHRDPAELGEFLTEAVSQLRAVHPDRSIELEVHGSTTGSWDAASLQRMLDNLVGNALKYGHQDTPVRVIVIGRDNDVAIEVHNQGGPVDLSTLRSFFEPLKRGPHIEGSASDDGLGLGLYIAREVVKAHGGDIEARSDPNGTVMVARLARVAMQDREVRSDEPSRQAP